MSSNFQLNLNRAHPDKFSLILTNIPSSELLSPSDTENDIIQSFIDDHNAFMLSLQTVDLPGLSIGEQKIPTMLSPIAHVDMVNNWESLTTEIRIDKHYVVYKLMMLWIHLIKNPEQFNQFKADVTFERTTTTGTVVVRENVKDSLEDDYSPVMAFDFYDLRPISISSLPLSYANSGDDISLTVTWLYSYFMPRKFNGDDFDLTLTRS
jgi:hypothetical protein